MSIVTTAIQRPAAPTPATSMTAPMSMSATAIQTKGNMADVLTTDEFLKSIVGPRRYAAQSPLSPSLVPSAWTSAQLALPDKPPLAPSRAFLANGCAAGLACPMPASRALRAAAVRSGTSRLTSTCETWLRTVFSQPPRDLVVAAAGRQQLEHVALARGQVGEGPGGRRLRLPAGEERDDAAGDRAAVHGVSRCDGLDGADDLGTVGALPTSP